MLCSMNDDDESLGGQFSFRIPSISTLTLVIGCAYPGAEPIPNLSTIFVRLYRCLPFIMFTEVTYRNARFVGGDVASAVRHHDKDC